MRCGHDDCYSCPYKDCISDVEVEPERKKKGRKKLPPEEKKRREKIAAHAYYVQRKEKWHNIYMQKSEGKVTKRYNKAI